MTKEQAVKILVNLINNLKLTKAEYDTLFKALQTISAEPEKKDGK